MTITSLKIVAIHDGLSDEDDPLLVELRERHGNDVVKYFPNSNKGLEYVLSNLNQRTVVILDRNFSKGEISGIKVFEEIRKVTSLVYVVFVTASQLETISNEELISLINQDAFAIAKVTDDYQELLTLVDKAVHELDVKVASVLEQWINSRPDTEKDEQQIAFTNGEAYTLRQILQAIREQTLFGMKVERNFLMLTINLLTRGKAKLDG